MELSSAYARRELSPVEVLEETLETAHRAAEAFNAFVYFDESGARASALASERRWAAGEALGILDGIPIPIKDTHEVNGWPLPRFGSFLTDGTGVGVRDAPIVSHLRTAGAALFARTLACEFGWKGIGDSPLYGAARNPWNPAHTPGGSSAGAAVSVASGVTRIAQGGDGGGSIRMPANFCGLFGLKVTAHRIASLYPSMGVLPNQGILTATAAETAAVYDVITAPYPSDSFQLPFQPIGDAEPQVAGLRIGLSLDLGFAGIDPEVSAAVSRAAEMLSSAGAEIVPLTIDLREYRRALDVIWSAGFRSQIGALNDEQRAVMDPGLVEVVDRLDEFGIMDLQRAHEDQARLSDALRVFEQDVDLILSATSLVLPPAIGEDYPERDGFASWFDWAGPTWIGNLSRRPAANIPFAFSEEGLPIGVQLMGPLFGERQILDASMALENLSGFAATPKPWV